ncbi:MAG: hypothetical protein ABIJ12_01765 [bacterium]
MDFAIRGWLFIVLGVVLIGIGGVCSTFGWDYINKNGRKLNILISLAREWTINQSHFNSKPLTFTSTSDNIGVKHNAYPRFQTIAFQNVVTSDIINDQELILLCINYIHLANVCNHVFSELDSELGKEIPREIRAQRYLEFNNTFTPLKNLKNLQNELKSLFEKKYLKSFKHAREFINNRSASGGQTS